MSVMIQQIQATHSHTILILLILSLCFNRVIISIAIYAHVKNMGLEIHLINIQHFLNVVLKFILMGKYYFFKRRIYLLTCFPSGNVTHLMMQAYWETNHFQEIFLLLEMLMESGYVIKSLVTCL